MLHRINISYYIQVVLNYLKKEVYTKDNREDFMEQHNNSDPGKGLGIASLVLSLLGVYLIGFILGIIGVIQSHKVKKTNGFAIAGIIISTLGTIFISLFILGMIINSADNVDTNSTTSSSTTISEEKTNTEPTVNNDGTFRFNDRADKQDEDVEVLPNESATVNGLKMTITNVEYKTSLGEYEDAKEGKTYLIASVNLENTSSDTKPFSSYDFRVQTTSGQVLDTALTFSITDTLDTADLVAGGKASGKVVFEVPIEDGHQYIIWKPNYFDGARAVVQVK